MTSLAALVLGSSLVAMAGGHASSDEDAVDTPEQAAPPAEAAKRSKHARAAVNAFMGISLEMGSVLFHVFNGGIFIGGDLDLTSAGCDAPDKPCGGPPFLIAVPLGAATMGWIGAARLAEAREANLRDSWVYWVGSAIEVASVVPLAAAEGHKDRDGRLAWHTTFVSMAALGTVLQVAGALTGPTRAEVVASRSPRVFPGCAPVSGGLTCGVLVAGF